MKSALHNDEAYLDKNRPNRMKIVVSFENWRDLLICFQWNVV